MAWPLEIGSIPPKASAFQPRSGLRERIDQGRSDTGAVVLTQRPTRVLSGGGGVGKSQLAAACAIDALEEGYDLVVWAPATEVQAVITQYAQAAAEIQLPGATGQNPEADARALLKWLSTTSRRWLVVLDDVSDPAALNSWWPASRTGSGWVLATTRRKDALLTGNGRTRIDIDVYTDGEADAYLRSRLSDHNMEHLVDEQAPALITALGHLPLALSHAAAYMINEELTTTAYLSLFNNKQTKLDAAFPASADTDSYGRGIATTLLLSLDAVQGADTAGIATQILRITSLLDPAGHPHALWSTESLLAYLSEYRMGEHTGDVTSDQTHAALRLLHRFALLTCDTRAEPRAVRIHALTARAVRESIPEAELALLALITATALLAVWPDPDQLHRDRAAKLRSNADSLVGHAEGCMWHPDAHPLLYRVGRSLFDEGLVTAAVSYWESMVRQALANFGVDHPDTLAARANLAASYWQAGRMGEAIAIEERLLVDRERVSGADHPETLRARANLAVSYWQVGRTGEAIAIGELVLVDRERILGVDHPDTLLSRANLAVSYWRAGGRVGRVRRLPFWSGCWLIVSGCQVLIILAPSVHVPAWLPRTTRRVGRVRRLLSGSGYWLIVSGCQVLITLTL